MTSAWPYKCGCGSIPYKSKDDDWICPSCCRDDNKKSFEEKVILAASKTWQIIGDDCLVDEDGNVDYSVSMTREQVCEIVADASYMQTHGGLSKEDMSKFYRELTHEERRKLMRKAFVHNTYGW